MVVARRTRALAQPFTFFVSTLLQTAELRTEDWTSKVSNLNTDPRSDEIRSKNWHIRKGYILNMYTRKRAIPAKVSTADRSRTTYPRRQTETSPFVPNPHPLFSTEL